MSTLHIHRSEPDDLVRDLVRELSTEDSEAVTLSEDSTHYDELIEAILSHDRVISWW